LHDDGWLHVLYDDGDEEGFEAAELLPLIEVVAVVEVETSKRPKLPLKKTTEQSNTPTSQPLWSGLNLASLPGISSSLAVNMADFFLFCRERQTMWWRRAKGEPRPWSCVEVMNALHFCNIYRELDRGTAYFRSLVLDLPPAKDKVEWTRQVLWLSYAYRQVNRVESFQQVGVPDERDLKPFLQGMSGFQKEGRAFFTSAHQTTHYKQYENYLKQTAGTLKPIAEVICSEDTSLQGIHRTLKTLKGIGVFLAWQLICDLHESGCLEMGEEFCVLGPGAKSACVLALISSVVSTTSTSHGNCSDFFAFPHHRRWCESHFRQLQGHGFRKSSRPGTNFGGPPRPHI
jgi:hypothetical protein